MNFMKKYKSISLILSAFLFLQVFTFTAFANSSWAWISETKPYDVLPWVAIGTLLIEALSIIFFAKIKYSFAVFTIVTIANAISFATPYLVNFLIYYEEGFPFKDYLDSWPSYTVGILFCVVTIIIEFPIVYFLLKDDENSNKRLVCTIIISNIVTTILVAIIERIFCTGSW